MRLGPLALGVRRGELVVIVALLGFIIVAALIAWNRGRPVALALPDPSPAASPGLRATSITVHIVGAVARPGVYVLDAGARVGDVVRAAGGLGAHADPLRVNLARPLVDGEQVIVWRDDGGGRSGESTPAPAQASGGSAASSGSLVNINAASAAELEELPGIGPTLAQRIVDDRTANGPFANVDDLDRVSGIGPATLERLRPYVTV